MYSVWYRIVHSYHLLQMMLYALLHSIRLEVPSPYYVMAPPITMSCDWPLRLQTVLPYTSNLLPADTLMAGPNSPLLSADRRTRPSFLERRTAAAARTSPIMLPVLVDLGAFLPLRLALTCSSPAALRGVTARSAV